MQFYLFKVLVYLGLSLSSSQLVSILATSDSGVQVDLGKPKLYAVYVYDTRQCTHCTVFNLHVIVVYNNYTTSAESNLVIFNFQWT